MLGTFDDSISRLKSSLRQAMEVASSTDAGMAGVGLIFAEGTELEANYSLVVKHGKERIRSFDQRQEYGLSTPLDAVAQLQKELQGETVMEARLDKETRDRLFQFTEKAKLHVFAFSGCEVSEIHIPGRHSRILQGCEVTAAQ